MVKKIFNDIFKYKEKEEYEFILPDVANNIAENEFNEEDNQTVYKSIDENLYYLKIKYNMLINSDIKSREFTLNIYFLY